MSDDLRPSETTGKVFGLEFVTADDKDETDKPEGTYVIIRVDDPNIRWSAGKVAIRYLPPSDLKGGEG